MNGQKEVILSGVGGQGMILSGTLLGEAATIYDQKNATLSSDYGVETRGTFARADLIVSDEEIFFPYATKPDIVVCLHQTAYARYAGKLPEEALLLYDSDRIKPDVSAPRNEKGIPIAKLAEQLGNPMTANMITMGLVAGKLLLVSPDAVKRTIHRFFHAKGEKVLSLNQKAFDTGYEIGINI